MEPITVASSPPLDAAASGVGDMEEEAVVERVDEEDVVCPEMKEPEPEAVALELEELVVSVVGGEAVGEAVGDERGVPGFDGEMDGVLSPPKRLTPVAVGVTEAAAEDVPVDACPPTAT